MRLSTDAARLAEMSGFGGVGRLIVTGRVESGADAYCNRFPVAERTKRAASTDPAPEDYRQRAADSDGEISPLWRELQQRFGMFFSAQKHEME